MPEYLHQIHLEGKLPHVITSNEALSSAHESRTQGPGGGSSDHDRAGTGVPTSGYCLCRSSPNANVFKEKGGKQES